MEPGTNIIVAEPVYAETEDGRTVLAAAVGDELTQAQADALKVGADGKSKNGVKPATELRREPTGEKAGGFATPAPPSGAEEAVAPTGFAALNAKDAAKAIKGMNAVELEQAYATETARGDAQRVSVMKALDARTAALKDA